MVKLKDDSKKIKEEDQAIEVLANTALAKIETRVLSNMVNESLDTMFSQSSRRPRPKDSF